MKLTPEKLAELRAKAAALRTQPKATIPATANGGENETGGSANGIVHSLQESIHRTTIGSVQIEYNPEQLRAIKLATEGKSFVLTGPAGTGKTTTTKGCIESIVLHCNRGPLQAEGHKHLASGSPGIVCCAYTRRAVQNIRKVMPGDIAENCITIHKLLEYEPTYYSVIDEETGEERNTMRFEPRRGPQFPLPESIHTLIIDEASMVSVELYHTLMSAFQHPITVIFIGDIQQLPPVFGSAILGYKLLELPVVNLTKVYRQALESPIIRLAHRILSGTTIPDSELAEWFESGKLKLHPWKKRLSADLALLTAAKFLTTAIEVGEYDPEEDIVLCPFNKAFGTVELNAHIANYLGKKRNALVYEIVCGFNRKYLAVGDRVLYDKEDAIIVDIKYNPSYAGKQPQEPSATLDRWGQEQGTEHHLRQETELDIDSFLDNISTSSEERKKSASHIITLRMSATDAEIEVDTVGGVSSIDLGYALTVHKSQGSEWRKVFLLLHNSHATMLQRELLYTACTRAREELYVICEKDSFIKGIESQRIKGNTVEEKAEYFKGKIERNELQLKTGT